MAEISYRHRFPPVVIQHAVWLYLRFTLSYRDVEELLAELGLDMSYESVRSWVLKFRPMIARRLRQGRPRPSDRWHLDEMVIRIAGRRMYLWRAVDHEGEILDILVHRKSGSHQTPRWREPDSNHRSLSYDQYLNGLKKAPELCGFCRVRAIDRGPCP